MGNLSVGTLCAQPAPAAAPPAKPQSAPPATTAAPATSAKPAQSQPGTPAATTPSTIPVVDVNSRNKQVLAHLNAAIRFFRASQTQVQKIGEPSDVLYREEAILNAKQAVGYAFDYGKAEAALLAMYQHHTGGAQPSADAGEADKLAAIQANTARQVQSLKAQQKTLTAQLQTARGKQLPTLRAQLTQVQGELELNDAMTDALAKIVGMSETRGQAGLAGDIDRLQRSAPELTDKKSKVVTPTLESFSQASTAGVTSQAEVLWQLLGTRTAIDQYLVELNEVHQQALDLRTPLTNMLRISLQEGQSLSSAAATPVTAPAPQAAGSPKPVTALPSVATETAAFSTQPSFDAVTARFKLVSDAAVPLSQEIITLEQGKTNLTAWRAAVQAEYARVLHSLLLRIMVIVIALGVLLAAGEAWRRITTRYVHDSRRRRQLLGMRRLVVGVLSGLVLVFGFVTNFTSLATFAGFITAGLAVGLQTILLSVAAYFFIVGRYGVRVGDRITITGVTGDVIEVGLVRFYVMELAGSGTELQPTGRVAVFSNAILFQAATPLYKQLPGTEYAWHELTLMMVNTADYRQASTKILAVVQKVYEGYRPRIELQQRSIENWMDARGNKPVVEARFQLQAAGLQLTVRFPVEIRDASEIDEKVTEDLLALMRSDVTVSSAVSGAPVIQAAVKG